ncbi:MAG: NAD(P)-binding domain-containing protein, partial [Anaerolineae bacterium]|nr:NAD(P)-binding domain-containing protein [Anaerolineae bacterium]
MKSDGPIVIFGGGSLGSAIARGFVLGGVPRNSIHIIQRNDIRREKLRQEGFDVWSALPERMDASLVLIVVKPKDVATACSQITLHISGNPIIISAVAGVSGEQLIELLGPDHLLFRAKFSILAEAGSLPIPVICCNEAANEKFPLLAQLIRPLGNLTRMPEAEMDVSGWYLSSLPCIILGGMM